MSRTLRLTVMCCSFPGGRIVLHLSWRQDCAAASSGFPQPPCAGKAAKEVSPSGCPSQLSPPRGLQLSSWAQPNKGCSRCQQIPGNEHSLYRGLPSPTSWRGTQKALKFILKYVVFTQKAFMAFCLNTCAIWAQDNAQRDAGLSRLVHNLELLAWSFLSKTHKSLDSS